MRLGAEADGRGERLAGEHMGAVEFAGDHPVEQNLPVRLGFEGDIEALILEVAVLIGDRERRHVGQLDEAEFQLVLLDRQHLGAGCGGEHRHGRCHQNLVVPNGLDHLIFLRRCACGAKNKKAAEPDGDRHEASIGWQRCLWRPSSGRRPEWPYIWEA
jgi:hypothetical protein